MNRNFFLFGQYVPCSIKVILSLIIVFKLHIQIEQSYTLWPLYRSRAVGRAWSNSLLRHTTTVTGSQVGPQGHVSFGGSCNCSCRRSLLVKCTKLISDVLHRRWVWLLLHELVAQLCVEQLLLLLKLLLAVTLHVEGGLLLARIDGLRKSNTE